MWVAWKREMALAMSQKFEGLLEEEEEGVEDDKGFLQSSDSKTSRRPLEMEGGLRDLRTAAAASS